VLITRVYGHEMSLRMLAVTPDSRTLIVGGTPSTSSVDGVVSLLSAVELDELVSVEPCTGYPGHLAVFPELSRVYVRCDGDHATVADIDLGLRRVVRAAVLDDAPGQADGRCGPGGIALSPSGGLVLVPCGTSGQLLYLDRLKLEVLDSVGVGVGVFDIATAPGDPVALVTLPDSQAIAFVDLRNRSVTTRLLTPGRPVSVGISGDGKTAYVLSVRVGLNSAALVRVDVTGEQILSTVAVPSGSRFLALWPGRWSPAMRWR
jgi:DNA-binding beta-propeller fold protein YncE